MCAEVARAYASKFPRLDPDILGFLRTFQGAAASFARENGHWSLWLPEFPADEHPVTPASQIFFPVILRHAEQAFAIRFFYDCSTSKVRYYTSAIPDEIARLPELENAISELFRHSLPVEPIRQRSLGRREGRPGGPTELPLKRLAGQNSLAEPVDVAVPLSRPQPPVVRPQELAVSDKTSLMPGPASSRQATKVSGAHTLHIEIGPAVRSVLMAFVLTLGFLILAGIGAYTYLRATEDPGVLHHRLQIEEMRERLGR